MPIPTFANDNPTDYRRLNPYYSTRANEDYASEIILSELRISAIIAIVRVYRSRNHYRLWLRQSSELPSTRCSQKHARSRVFHVEGKGRSRIICGALWSWIEMTKDERIPQRRKEEAEIEVRLFSPGHLAGRVRFRAIERNKKWKKKKKKGTKGKKRESSRWYGVAVNCTRAIS